MDNPPKTIRAFVDPDTGAWVAVVDGQPYLSWIASTKREAVKGLLMLLANINQGTA